MKRNKNIQSNLKRSLAETKKNNLSVREKAAFEMLQQTKIRKLSSKDEH